MWSFSLLSFIGLLILVYIYVSVGSGIESMQCDIQFMSVMLNAICTGIAI